MKILKAISSAVHQWNVSVETCEICDSRLCTILLSASRLVLLRASAPPQKSAALASHTHTKYSNTHDILSAFETVTVSDHLVIM